MNVQCESGVSVIIPARNEEWNIEGVVRSLASQAGVCRIIVVDDQSEDRTPEILRRLESEFSNVFVRRIESLPPGWHGKPYAASEGTKLATANWLLFTDADTRHKPGSVAALRKLAEARGAAMLSISPAQRTERWWEKAVIPLVYIQLAALYDFEDVSNPNSAAAAANGQYILIRRDVLGAVGGFESVRDDILEDVALARRVKASGGRILFLPGAEWVETRMYRTFGGMWRGWTKNLFLLFGSSRRKMAMAALRLLLVQWAPGAALVFFTAMIISGVFALWILLAWGACLIAFVVQQRAHKDLLQRLGFSPSLSPYILAGAPMVVALMVSSAWAYRSGGSIQWKGRYYPAKGAR
ncbi:MAG: glycosyltransferase [Acidobacteriota bacterium]|nr:glycosyltransferase [Acidobacteriota bacterium]